MIPTVKYLRHSFRNCRFFAICLIASFFSGGHYSPHLMREPWCWEAAVLFIFISLKRWLIYPRFEGRCQKSHSKLAVEAAMPNSSLLTWNQCIFYAWDLLKTFWKWHLWFLRWAIPQSTSGILVNWIGGIWAVFIYLFIYFNNWSPRGRAQRGENIYLLFSSSWE